MNVKISNGEPQADEPCAFGTEALPVADITTVLQALGDPIRIAIVRSLAGDEARPCGSFGLPVTKSTLTHHFRVLRDAGIINTRADGTRKLISLRRADLDAAYPGLIGSILDAAVREPAQI
jgi:DNA-binding transcriptional ArsR family regulator